MRRQGRGALLRGADALTALTRPEVLSSFSRRSSFPPCIGTVVDQPAGPYSDRDAAVFAEQIAMVYRLTLHTLAMSIVGSTLVLLALWPSAPRTLLTVWYLLHHTVTLCRYLLLRAYNTANPPVAIAPLWARRFVVGTVAAGTVWGICGSVLFPPAGDPAQFFISIYLIGTAATGMFTLSAYFLSFIPLAAGALVPMIVWLLVSGVPSMQFAGGASFLFVYITFSNGRRFERITVDAIRLRLELSESKEAAEAASKAKSQFLANMSHEIRTPMNGVLGIAEILLAAPLNAIQRRHVETLYRSGQSLLDVINDVLDFSKIEAGKLDLRTHDFSLRALLAEVTDSFITTAAGKGLTLSLVASAEVPVGAHGDEPRLRQVLTNLIGNAIKFTDVGEVTVAVSYPDRRRLRFEVRDTGIGLAPDEAALVFDAFAQADGSHARRFGGTGLGLTISRQLIKLMGGEIGVESTRGKGSTFWVSLPFDPPRAPLPESSGPKLRTADRRLHGRVLLVEDNAVNQLVAQTFLEELQVDVAVANNGRTAVERVSSERFDLVLMDCQMPDMDGFEATAIIRQKERIGSRGRAIPIVALTANAVEGDRERCIAAGMDDYLSKPFNRDQLAALLVRWLPDLPRTAPPSIADPVKPDAALTTVVPATAATVLGESVDANALNAFRDLPGSNGALLVHQMIDMYLTDTPVRVGQMQAAADRGDVTALRIAAHSAKSSSAFVGAQRVAGLCKELELMAPENVTAIAPPILLQLASEVALVMESLRAMRNADA